MTDADSTQTSKPGAQVVIESLIHYAQRDYEAKRIGWASYAAYTLSLYTALCGIELEHSTEES